MTMGSLTRRLERIDEELCSNDGEWLRCSFSGEHSPEEIHRFIRAASAVSNVLTEMIYNHVRDFDLEKKPAETA